MWLKLDRLGSEFLLWHRGRQLYILRGERPHAESTSLKMLCLLLHQLALRHHPIWFISPTFLTQHPQRLGFIIFWTFSKLLEQEDFSGAWNLFSGTKPSFARSHSGAFPENSGAVARKALNRGAAPLRGSRVNAAVLVGKASPQCGTPLKERLGFSCCSQSDSQGSPRVRASCCMTWPSVPCLWVWTISWGAVIALAATVLSQPWASGTLSVETCISSSYIIIGGIGLLLTPPRTFQGLTTPLILCSINIPLNGRKVHFLLARIPSKHDSTTAWPCFDPNGEARRSGGSKWSFLSLCKLISDLFPSVLLSVSQES